MDQIFRRIKNIAKSYINDTDAERIINSDDDELRKIIDNLNAEPTKHAKQKSTPQPKPEEQLPPEVIDAYRALGLNFSAGADEIKSAYKAKIKLVHPDAAGNVAGDDRAVRLNQAYNTLKKYRNF
ncbi:MAG: J domain-containing protein [Candidatus Kapabacteria bacterium]|nr:J domain-containing protein [Candidatus Kapabacteria bacterium]